MRILRWMRRTPSRSWSLWIRILQRIPLRSLARRSLTSNHTSFCGYNWLRLEYRWLLWVLGFCPYVYFGMGRPRFRPFVLNQLLLTYITLHFWLLWGCICFLLVSSRCIVFCYCLWHMTFICLYLVTMVVCIFIITYYYLSMYDLFTFLFYSLTWGFNMLSG